LARVYAFRTHVYEHRQEQNPVRIRYIFPAQEAREVPDDIAMLVTTMHPAKLRLLGEYEAPPSPAGPRYQTEMLGSSPDNRMMVPTVNFTTCEAIVGSNRKRQVCGRSRPCHYHDRG
jgi:hypothetical protein